MTGWKRLCSPVFTYSRINTPIGKGSCTRMDYSELFHEPGDNSGTVLDQERRENLMESMCFSSVALESIRSENPKCLRIPAHRSFIHT